MMSIFIETNNLIWRLLDGSGHKGHIPITLSIILFFCNYFLGGKFHFISNGITHLHKMLIFSEIKSVEKSIKQYQ